MRVTIFGATGQLGGECLRQAVEAGHDVTVLVRTPAKLVDDAARRAQIIEGDALIDADVARAVDGAEAVLFAIGVDKHSPEDLCTDATKLIVEAMSPDCRFIWCGGGSTYIDGDPESFGARFVRWFAKRFLGLRHRDKDHQLTFLQGRLGVDWHGVRPLQMRPGPHTGTYRLGMNDFSGLSKISFADCADAMLQMLDDDTWRHRAPIIQY
ncbi:MAG: NAD(P)H-binding protein [Actinomycetota bacterium]